MSSDACIIIDPSIVKKGKLGQGGQGKVYYAVSEIYGEVALKKFTEQTRFDRESNILSQISHPYVIRQYGIIKIDNRDYIMMEYASNGTLKDYIIQNKLSWDEKYQLAKDITRGVQKIHEQGILHRDIKNINILMDHKNRPKLADFGFAKHDISKSSNNSALTVCWSPPESFNGQYIDKSDIFSLGMVFWNIACEVEPYNGLIPNEILKRVFNYDLPAIPENAPADFKDIIKMCWHKDPSRRPSASSIIRFFSKDDEIWKFCCHPDFESDIFKAVQMGNKPSVIHLLSNGTDINIRYNMDTLGNMNEMKNSTLLHIATRCNQLDMVELLLKYDAKHNLKDSSSKSPLFYSVLNDSLEIVDCFVSHQADVNIVDNKSCIPLHYACEYGYFSIVEYLIQHNSDVNAKDSSMLTPLHYAAKMGKINIVGFLINNNAKINIKDRLSKTPIQYATDKKFKNVVDYISKRSNEISQLHIAVYDGNIKEVQHLLETGYNVNISYPYDEIKGVKMSNLAPLHIAIQCGNFDMVKTLVTNGADVNLIASFKMRPLHLAVKARNLQIIEYLIENKADINAKDINSNTPLHNAAEFGVFSIVELLVRNNAIINLKNNNLETPLNCSKNQQITQFLSEHK